MKRWLGIFGILAVVAAAIVLFRYRLPQGYYGRIHGHMTPEQVAVVMGRNSDHDVTSVKSGHRIQTWVFPGWQKDILVTVEYGEGGMVVEKRLEEVLMDTPYYVLLDKHSFSQRPSEMDRYGRV